MADRSLPPIAFLLLAALGSLDVALGIAAAKSVAPGSPAPLPEAEVWRLPPNDVAPGPIPVGAYQQTLARPVFWRARQPRVLPPVAPAPIPVADLPAPPSEDPGFRLLGVMIAGPQRRAFIASQTRPSGDWRAERGDFDGWTIASVDPQHVTLRSGSRQVRLQLYRDQR